MKTFALGLVMGVVLTPGVAHWVSDKKPKFTTPYQAVLLDDNQVFYGKLASLNAAHPILTDAYYIPRAGKELYGLDKMYLSARHIALAEPVTPNSQVAKLIEQSKNE